MLDMVNPGESNWEIVHKKNAFKRKQQTDPFIQIWCLEEWLAIAHTQEVDG